MKNPAKADTMQRAYAEEERAVLGEHVDGVQGGDEMLQAGGSRRTCRETAVVFEVGAVQKVPYSAA
jgi:hypothetical protein